MDAAPSRTTERNLRWFHPTPGRLLVVLLMMQGILLLSERWFPKGWAVLIAIASVVVTMVMMLCWFVLALCFDWRFQFSLRSLLVLTVVVAIPFSWLGVEMKRAREQREAVEEIQKLGGEVQYDREFSESLALMPNPAPPKLVWLQAFLDGDFFDNVVGVLFKNCTQVTDAGLHHLRGLAQLQVLELDDTQISDAGLIHLQTLKQLQVLLLNNTHISDAGLGHLKGLTQLQHVWLSNTHTTNAGLEHLTGLTQLQDLNLVDTQVTDQGVRKLQQALPNCKITTK
jgi:hypothetical protein